MPVPSHVFVSDVHLGAFSGSKKEKIGSDLIELIHYCREHEVTLSILGDLFDYWMEYPEYNFVPDIGREVLDAFERYNREFKPALYITGNHDNWTSGHFTDRGFDVETRYRIVEIDGYKVFLMHGDGQLKNKGNIHYPHFHRLLRSPRFIRLYQRIFNPATGLRLMKWFSNSTSKIDRRDIFPLNNQAELILETMDIDWVIMGHDHMPRLETFSLGSYINTGTFFEHKTVGIYNKNGFDLVRWVASTKDFVPLKESIAAD